jgi:N-methylhydantoinase A
MLPIGGAGPVHACHVALKLGIKRAVIPLGAGVASAFGFLASPMSFQFVQASISSLAGLDLDAVRHLIGGLESKGRALLLNSGVGQADCRVRLSAAMRYVGQGYEVEVPVPALDDAQGLREQLAAEFARCYAALYGRTEKDTPAEVVSWRVVVHGPTPELMQAVAAPTVSEATGRDRAEAARKGERRAYNLAHGDFTMTPVYDRYRLAPGARFTGMAIVEERESTVIIPEGSVVNVDGYGNLLVDLPVKAA